MMYLFNSQQLQERYKFSQEEMFPMAHFSLITFPDQRDRILLLAILYHNHLKPN